MINLTDAATISTPQTSTFKPTYTSGLIPAKLLAINPTPEQYLKLTGSEPKSFEMEYNNEQTGGKRLRALISYENAFGRTEYTFVKFYDLLNELTMSKAGNKQFIDSKGNSTWSTSSDGAAERLKGEIRHGRKGEEQLLQLLVMQLNWRYDDATKNIFKLLEEKKCFKKADDFTTFDFAGWNDAMAKIHANGLDVAVFMYSKSTPKEDKVYINSVAETAAIFPYYRLAKADYVLKNLSQNWEKDAQYRNIPSNFASMQVGWVKSETPGFTPFGGTKQEVAPAVEEKMDDLPF